ncbi:MAG TPA: hypothetical protein VGO66_08590 [Solirubrobacterales bacterium]|jgi:hypothetical protein|nr:hypothetical protein [Solirubrobacterales bacterium]
MSEAPPRAAVLASESDRAVAERLEADLAVLGVRLQRFALDGENAFAAVIVVQGPGAAAEDAWRASLAAVSSARLIPVVVEGVPDAEVPEPLRSLNWVRWPAKDGEVAGVTAAAASTAVFTALSYDFDLLQFHRELEAEAQAWVDGDRDAALLIDNRRRVRRAAEHLRVAGDDVLSRASTETKQFVAASDVETRRVRRKRRWRWVRRGGALALVAFLFGGLVIDRKANVANSHLAVMVYGAKQHEGRPDRGAMVAAATLIQGRPVAYEMATRVLLDSLSSPWSAGVLGVEETAGLLDAVPVRGGDSVYTVDASGQVGLWDARTGAARWQREIGLGEERPEIAASADGRLLAVVDGRRIGLARVAPWRLTRRSLPVEATAIAFDPQRSRFVVAGAQGLVSVAADGSDVGRVPVTGDVLDLVTGRGGRALALVAAGPGAVEVIDAVSGTVVRKVSGAGAIERGAVGPAGEVVVNADDRLLVSRAGADWRPLGKEGSGAGVLRVLPGGVLASGGWGTPLEMTELATGTDLGPLCPVSVAVHSVRATPSGELLACTNGWVTELWSTTDQKPLRRRPPGRGLRGSPFLGRPGLVIRGGRDGMLTVKVTDGDSISEYALPVGSGRVEAVALSTRDSYSIVAGTSRGELAEFDLRRTSLSKTVSWKVPGGGAIRQVGWARGAGRLLVGTANGFWWRPRSCDACQDIRVAIAQARDRFWGCYPSDALDFMAGETEQALALTACRLPPDPR